MDPHVQALTTQTLTPLVRQCLADPSAEIESWQIDQIAGGTGGAIGGTALFRVRGQTTDNCRWSLILKVLYERPGEMQDAPYYWKREYELYRSGMLDQLPDIGLTTPAMYGFADYADSCWIWMEDIPIERRRWSLEDYRMVARCLGQFNGVYAAGHPIPDEPWLNVNWHCRITPPLADTFDKLDADLRNPLVQRALPLGEHETIAAIWQDVHLFCDGLAGLPQTLCHTDVFPPNVFLDSASMVLIDWALAGRAAIGEELVALVAVSLSSSSVPISDAALLDRTVFDGYVEGLRDAGWSGDPQLARLGYTCAMTLRGLAGVKQDIGCLLDEGYFANLRQSYNMDSMTDLADHFAAVRRYRLIAMAAEARQLMADLK